MRGGLTRIRQILLNLLSNAVKFSKEGEVSLRVRIPEIERSEVVVFEIADTGIGMTAEQRGRLFQLFSQAGASTSKLYGGMRSGLAISKRFRDAMNESIAVESQPGQGTRYIVTLPLRSL